jgi:AraC-like DNA-binding protein
MDLFAISCYVFSIFNLLLLTLLLWVRRNNNNSNKIFGLYILLLSVPLVLNLSTLTGVVDSRYYFLCLLPALLLGPVAYTFCLQFVQIELPPKRLLLQHYLPASGLALVLSILVIAIQQGRLDGNLLLFKGDGIPDFFRSIIVTHACAYHFYCWWLSKKLLAHSNKFPEATQKKISWLYDFFRNTVIIFILFILFHTIRMSLLGYTPVGSSVITPLLLLLSYFLILYKSLSYVPVFASNREETSETILPEDKKQTNSLSDDLLFQIEVKLQEAMKGEQLFKDPTLNLHRLSGHLEVPPRSLSQFIHQQYQTNFSDFVSKYRVEESMNLMQNPAMQHLKLEAIAEASGFSSRASFFSIFKKVTGLTPAMYRKEHAPNSTL